MICRILLPVLGMASQLATNSTRWRNTLHLMDCQHTV